MTHPELTEKINAVLRSGDKIKHTTGKSILLFPSTTGTDGPKVCAEITSSDALVGAVARQTLGVKAPTRIDIDAILDEVIQSVECDEERHLRDIVRRFGSDENGVIRPFTPKAYPYITAQKQSRIDKVARYLVGAFFNESAKDEFRQVLAKMEGNLLHGLIMKGLPGLQNSGAKQSNSYAAGENLRAAFRIDLSSLCARHVLKAEDLRRFLLFYLFSHQLQILLRFRSAFHSHSPGVPFFTVSWEKVSSTRRGYQGGWRSLDALRKDMFTYAVCCEMLNQVELPGLERPFGYSELVDYAQQAGGEGEITQIVESITDQYRTTITDVNWRGAPTASADGLAAALKKLHETVKYQFKPGNTRSAANDKYNKWLHSLGVAEFFKHRGRNGYTLSLNREWFLFLTALCCGHKPERKLRLADFWLELERRGIALDYDSRQAATKFLEDRNLLEKKSDSGDAQYVRAAV